MATMGTYDLGDLVRISAAFSDANGAALNPTAVYCKVKNPNGTITAYTYGTDAALVRASTGSYYVDVDANTAGVWKYRFHSTGTGQAAAESWFTVEESEFD